MSNAVFPSLPGLAWGVKRSVITSTLIANNSGGKETRVAQWQDPLYEWTLPYELLRDASGTAELQALLGFIVARQGSFDSFLYTDPVDNLAYQQSCYPAMGDGSNKLFQLARQLGGNGYSETVQNVNGSPAVYLAGTLQGSGYTVSDTGLIAFTTAPANGAAVQWTGNFYFRCRFSADTQQFSNDSNGWWSNTSGVVFRSVKL